MRVDPLAFALDAFGQRLRRVLDTPEAYALLEGAGNDGTWTAGACWPLAIAVARILGPGATLRYLRATRGATVGLVEHVVVCYGPRVLDGDGACTRAEALRLWRDHRDTTVRFSVRPPSPQDADGPARSWDLDTPLVRFLRLRLGRYVAAVRAASAPGIAR